MRVVPNLYPALERQEVCVHTPRHARSLAELEPGEFRAVAEAWSLRAAAAQAAGFPYVHAFVNEGREAGASLPHSHSQLAWLREAPAAVADTGEPCRVCAWLAGEIANGERLVLDHGDVVVLAAYAGRLPYELVVVPKLHERSSGFTSQLLGPAVELLGEATRRLHAVEGPVPLNAWLHDGPHWRLELVPRLNVLAGLELGAGIYVNAVPPEQAASLLRDAPAGLLGD